MYINDKKLGKHFGVSRQTVWRWVKSKPDFPAPYSLSPGCTRWKMAEIEAWDASRKKLQRAA